MPGYEKEGQSPANIEALIQKVLSDREGQKEQAKKIDGLQQDMRLVKGLICDKDGNCRLPTLSDLEMLVQRQAGIDGAYKEIEKKWNGLTEEQRAALPLIPRDAHATMLRILEQSDKSKKGLNRSVATRLTPEEWSQLMESEPELLEKISEALVCTTPECKARYNELLEKAKVALGKQKGQKGESWLVKK